MKKRAFLFLLVFVFAISAHAGATTSSSSSPDIFVQTGHSGRVKFVALNPSGNHLVTMEQGSLGHFIKTWNVASGREIITFKLETEYGYASNLHFLDDNKFIVFYQKSAEIFDLYGQKLQSIKLPKIIFVRLSRISKDGQYLINQEYGSKIYSMRDGSEIVPPEIQKYQSYQRYNTELANLGYGYYGVFYKGQNPRYNVDYVIYDEHLNVRKKGSLNIPNVYFGSTFKASPDLKYVAYNASNYPDDILIFDLSTSELALKYQAKTMPNNISGVVAQNRYISFLPDGRLSIEYDQTREKPQWAVKMELTLINLLRGGMYSEKRLVVDDLDSSVSNQTKPYLITNQGSLIAGMVNGNVRIIDIASGNEIKSFGVKPSVYNTSYCSGNQLINWVDGFSSISRTMHVTFNLWDIGEARLKRLNVTTESGLKENDVKIGKNYVSGWISTDPEKLYSQIPRELLKPDYKNDDNYGRPSGMFHVMNDNGDYFTTREEHKLVLKSRKTKAKIADLYAFEDGEWIIITPDGYYSASANGDKYLSVRKDKNIYGIENYREAFFRPDLVKIAIRGNSLEGYKTLAQVANPPAIRIENAPGKIDADSVRIIVRITDMGGGIGDVRLYLNDTSIATESARGISIKPAGDSKDILRSYTLKLLSGENIIKAIVFDKDNNVQSNPAVHKITAAYKSAKKPVLYALVIGINEYKNPKLTLKYAAADAKLFADTLHETAGRLFDKVNITRLTTRDTASKNSILKELQKYKNLNPDDVFAFYVASHGTVDDGQYYLITSNVGALSTDKLKADAITQKELREAIANVPTAKKFIVIDTCNAGKLGEQLQVAMLTRGMNEDTAMKILSRAVGSTIISASTSLQEALEGYKDHGLFTYVLTEGMRGKADVSRSGFVKTSDLANYVEETVPEIAENVFKRAQYPTKAVNGNDFPIGRIK